MMSERRRFATGTTVPVEQTRIELERLLGNHGASQIAVYTDRAAKTGRLVFKIAGRMVRLDVKATPPTHPKGGRPKSIEQTEREAWRRLLLVVKAKLELVADAGDIATVEREFLADILLPNGQTVHEQMAEGIERAYATGAMPSLMLPAAGGSGR